MRTGIPINVLSKCHAVASYDFFICYQLTDHLASGDSASYLAEGGPCLRDKIGGLRVGSVLGRDHRKGRIEGEVDMAVKGPQPGTVHLKMRLPSTARVPVETTPRDVGRVFGLRSAAVCLAL